MQDTTRNDCAPYKLWSVVFMMKVTEWGRSAQVARGLNTISANIVANSGVLQKYGIQVKSANGDLKSTYDVLAELKPVWDNLTDAERQALGQTLAG